MRTKDDSKQTKTTGLISKDTELKRWPCVHQVENVNFRKARMYIASNLSKSEQRISNLYRVLPRRTARGEVRPGVTADPENEENWAFPPA